jgi:hypothetical protein
MTRQFKFNRTLYGWKHPAIDWELWQGSNLVANVKPDERYFWMFRIYRPGHPPSDIVNLSRAKDAAVALVDRDLDRRDCSSKPARTRQNEMSALPLPEGAPHD